MKKKRVVRFRGSKTHGWGSMKKHRGAGNRGGRGNAGSGKRGDQKKPMYWNPKKPMGQKYGKPYFGKSGFHSIHSRDIQKINVDDLCRMLPVWTADKKVTKSGETYTVDLAALGYEKLLGSGRMSAKVKVTVARATEKAVTKINTAGGSVTLLEQAASAADDGADESAEDS